MDPRRAYLLVPVLVALALPASATAVPDAGQRAPSVRAPSCSLPGSKTIAANRHVRVFRTRGAVGTVYGCRRRAGRAYELGVRGECQNSDEIDGAVVSGNLVALNVQTCDLHGTRSRVRLVSLHSGLVMFGSQPMTTVPTDDLSYDAIRGMVVIDYGLMAWLAVRVRRGVVVGVEVRRRAFGSRGRAVLMDSGPGIDPRSLRRSGPRASWLRDGVRRGARL